MPEKDDPVITFLKADTHGRVNLLGDKETASAVRHYLGGSAFAELENMAGRTYVQDHLAVKSPPNLVFVPGVIGSPLRSETKGGVWWIDARTRGHLDDLQLKPDGAEDLDANDQIDAFAVDTCYEPFATAVLARDDFGHRHFAYDWRKSFSGNTVALRNLIVHMHATNGGQPAVYGDVFRWLKGEPLSSLAETADDALSSHLSAITAASEAPHLDGTAKAEGDDPGYWRTSEVTASSLGALDQAVERGAVPEFNQLKLL